MSTSGFYEAVSPGTQPSYFDLESGLLSDVQTCPSSRVHTRPSSKGDTTKPGVDLQPEFGVQDEPIFHNFVWPPSTLHQPLPDNQLSLEPRKKRDTEGPDALLTKYIGLLEERATELHR